jgi:hypothetical protein
MGWHTRFGAIAFTILGAIVVSHARSEEAPGGAVNFINAMSLLKRPSVRAELALDNKQIEELIKLEVDRQDLFRGPLGRLQQATLEERRAAYEEYKRQLQELGKKAVAVLLPQQQVRLEQILLQQGVGALNRTVESRIRS